MPKFYFQWMFEGGGTACCTAFVCEASTFSAACWKWYSEKSADAYGGVPRCENGDEVYRWMTKMKQYVIHGAFQVPSVYADFTTEEIKKLWDEIDVRSFTRVDLPDLKTVEQVLALRVAPLGVQPMKKSSVDTVVWRNVDPLVASMVALSVADGVFPGVKEAAVAKKIEDGKTPELKETRTVANQKYQPRRLNI